MEPDISVGAVHGSFQCMTSGLSKTCQLEHQFERRLSEPFIHLVQEDETSPVSSFLDSVELQLLKCILILNVFKFR